MSSQESDFEDRLRQQEKEEAAKKEQRQRQQRHDEQKSASIHRIALSAVFQEMTPENEEKAQRIQKEKEEFEKKKEEAQARIAAAGRATRMADQVMEMKNNMEKLRLGYESANDKKDVAEESEKVMGGQLRQAEEAKAETQAELDKTVNDVKKNFVPAVWNKLLRQNTTIEKMGKKIRES